MKILFLTFVLAVSSLSAQEKYQCENEKWGFKNEAGREIIACKYDAVGGFSEGVAAVLYEGAVGYINEEDQVVVAFKYDWTSGFHNGRAVVKIGTKFGYIDHQGNEITPLQFDDAKDFDGRSAIVNVGGAFSESGFTGGKYGMIDGEGKIVIPMKYDYMEPFTYRKFDGKVQALAEVMHASKVRIGIDNSILTIDKKIGYIDSVGNEIIPIRYQEIEFFDFGFIAVRTGNKWGLLNDKGEKITPSKYDDEPYFQHLIISEVDTSVIMMVFANEKYGFVDQHGKEIIKPVYEDVLRFSEGLIAVKLKGKWGYLDEKGKKIIPFRYDEVTAFSKGIATVEIAGEKFNVDKTGKRL